MQRVLLLSAIVATSPAHATPPEPRGPHPRMLLDDELRAAWRMHAKLPAGPVIGAIRLCDEGRTTKKHDRALYQGGEWSKLLQACLVAYAATDNNEHAAGAIKFFEALIDDLDTVDDGRGGDDAAKRDSGYAIRNLGPYTALAYDWLHAHPLMTRELKARARQRWRSWLEWYRERGYRAKDPGSNYHAGYLVAATLIAIAQAGEAGPDGAALWAHVADQMWGKDMAIALSSDGVLAGGNWPEGWQYGPLATAEYALAARVVKRAGVDVPGIAPWLSSVLRHHVYSLSPADGVYPGGDTELETATIPPHVLTLDAVALGDASAEDRAWARGELLRLRLVDRDWFLYDALATVGDKPIPPPRTAWPTSYVAANTGTLYARTRWDESAIWFVAECHAAIRTDHRHANAGTFALTRGRDHVIVDPSPYGSVSTLTTNAPTVVSAHLPSDYIPSQGLWGEKVGYDFITQRASGIVAARCDYSDAYKFQHRPSDVPEALRDFVLVPSPDGRDAALVVIDRADTGGADRAMHLRFRSPGQLALASAGRREPGPLHLGSEAARATVGASQLVIASVARSSGKARIGTPSGKDCYQPGTAKGRCDAARLPVTDYRVEISGPRPSAVHVIGATGAGSPTPAAAALGGDGWSGVQLDGPRTAVVVWRTSGPGRLAYSAPPGMHVILDAVDGSQVTATRRGDRCAVDVSHVAGAVLRPVVARIDDTCNVTIDPESPAASALGTKPHRVHARVPRAGCCGAEAAPGSALAMAFVVIGLLARRRARR